MIKINATKNYITIKGHALYDEYGKDIVCSSVSSTVICTINGILKLNYDSIKVEQLDDGLKINIQCHDEVCDVLIINMLDCLKELEKQFPKNIQIKEEKK